MKFAARVRWLSYAFDYAEHEPLYPWNPAFHLDPYTRLLKKVESSRFKCVTVVNPRPPFWGLG